MGESREGVCGGEMKGVIGRGWGMMEGRKPSRMGCD